MTHPQITVIVPVHNAKETIGFCIDSILAQTLKEFEAIFVDDCSTDGSTQIIERFREQDDRVRLIKLEENGGQGRARNIGIDNAVGEYLSFVDSDDTIAPDFLELLYKKAQETNAEVVKGLCRKVPYGCTVEDAASHRIMPINAYIRSIRKSRLGRVFCFDYEHWSAIYKRRFIDEHGIRYGVSRVNQDTTFLLKVAAYLMNIETVDEAVYFYMQRDGSAVHTFNAKRFDAWLDAFEEQIDFANSEEAMHPTVHLLHISKMFAQALAAHSYLCINASKAEADAFADRIRALVKKYRYMNEIAGTDYALDAYVQSNGKANIAIEGRIVGLRDNSEWQLRSLEKLVEHINSDQANRLKGLRYLNKGLNTLYINAFVDSYENAEAWYKALSEGVRLCLMQLDCLDLVKKHIPLCHYLIEYGADLFRHFYAIEAQIDVNNAYMLAEQLSRINAFISMHTETVECVEIARALLNNAFMSATRMRSANPKRAYELFTTLFAEAEKLERITKSMAAG